MSCMSDVDLATLHKTRLEERVHYKLSWWARRFSEKQKHFKYLKNLVVRGESSATVDDGLIKRDTETNNEAEARLIENCSNDKEYFKSDVCRRRRSGTWP